MNHPSLRALALIVVCSLMTGTGCVNRDPASSDAGHSDATSSLPDSGSTADGGPTPDAAADAAPPEDDWGELEPADRDRFQSQLDRAVEDLALPGAAMAAARVSRHTVWAGASGDVDFDGTEPWTADRMVRIGSVTKTFTTAVLLQLVDEGSVSLDDPLERWVPGAYDDQGVLVRHLATNTSGIVSYNYVGSFDESRVWTPEELVDWAVQHEPDVRFEPGTEFEYSNTNFVLLGLVIEAVTGRSYADVVQSRLLEPLGLTDTYVAGANDDNPRVVPCFADDGTELTGAADPSMGWAAGAIVTTPRDLARWGASLYGGDVLTAEMLALMTTPAITTPDGVRYGMGTFIEGEGDETTFGHSGGIGGYLSTMYFLESESTVLVAMANVVPTDLRELSAYGWSVVLDVPYP